MDDLIKNIKNKLSADSLVEMMKEAKVIDNKQVKEEDVRKTLEKIDTEHLIDVDELAIKLHDITEKSKEVSKKEDKSPAIRIYEKAFSVLVKKNDDEKNTSFDEIPDNFTGFLD